MSAVQINQLARPRSTRYECEVCGKAAVLKCSECPTYYCTQEHFDVDWRGIRSLIAQDIVVLRERPKMIGSEEEREKCVADLMRIRRELLDLCTETAQKYLVQGKHDLAVPGALQSLKFAIEVYGSEASELVPSYLLLAEANLGLRRLKIAEEFLSLANWNILKHPQAGSSMMSNLQRNFGRLYAAQQRYNEALQAFATDIYYSSLEFGPESFRSAPAYYHMGRVFQRHQKSERASCFFEKVMGIYTNFLDAWLSEGGEGASSDIAPVEVEEAIENVKHISEYRGEKRGEEEHLDNLSSDTAEARHTLGLLLAYIGDMSTGKELVCQALNAYEAAMGVDNPRSLACQKHLDLLDKRGLSLPPEVA